MKKKTVLSFNYFQITLCKIGTVGLSSVNVGGLVKENLLPNA